ncbi:MAG TPA: serine/threonine-protein kinase [Gaiellaceae bacterium]|nr:serine/threonine-protein kinase [Gaiellaceae bacterium]
MTDEVIAGRYKLLEPLGRGSMSAVWRAHDDELDRDVAIKTLAPTADRDRFQREARAVAALAHPNICNLYDYGESDGRPYMVLEYLSGGTLEDRLKSGKPLPDEETERYATAIAAGLAHAHNHGVVHRDLKPANVLFDSEDRAKIADFGIASMGDAGTLTEAGTVLGTAAYISPEQASGLPATAASDVYSFGVMLFRMLTGVLPFISSNAMELVRMNRDDPPPAVADRRANAPAGLAWTADASLAKDPLARPADGAALVAALRDDGGTAATMLIPAAAMAGAATEVRSAPPARRRPLLPVLIVLALVLLLGGAALALALSNRSGGDSGNAPPASGPNISLPNVPTLSTSKGSTSVASTTSPSTTAPTTTAATTTAQTTTAHTATAHTTTAHTTTAHTTTAAPPTTTFDTTTAATTTDTTFTDTTATTTTTATPASSDQVTTASGP